MTKEKLWTRPFLSLMAINLVSSLSFYLLMVKMTEFAAVTYDVSYAIAATTVSVYVISALFARVLLGGRIDVWGVKRSLAAGMALNTVSSFAYLIPLPFEALIGVRIVHGIAFALTSGSAAAGAAFIIPATRRGEGIGYFSMMQALGTGIGPFVAIVLTEGMGTYSILFVVTGILCIIALCLTLMLKFPHFTPANEANASKREGFSFGKFVQISVLPLTMVLLLLYVGYSGILSFVVLYARDIDLEQAVSLYFVVYAITILVTRPPVGMRVDRKGENSCIYYSLVSVVVGLVVLALALNGFMLLLSAVLLGFGIGATQSIVQAVIARDTPESELGKANSTFFMSMDLGSGVGPVVIGAVIPLVGYRAMYAGLAVLAAFAIVVYHVAHGSKVARKRRNS